MYSYKQEFLDLAAVNELIYLFKYGMNLVLGKHCYMLQADGRENNTVSFS